MVRGIKLFHFFYKLAHTMYKIDTTEADYSGEENILVSLSEGEQTLSSLVRVPFKIGGS
jgi:hypothetical protein